MEDIMSKLQNILGTKEGQEQLKNLQNMFSGAQTNGQNAPQGTQQAQEQPQGGGLDFSSIASMLGGMSGTGNDTAAKEQPNTSDMPNIDMNMIMKLQQAFSSMNTNDKNSQLLLALKPHFSEQRSKKVDQAINIMRLFSMLPMLKESGILKGLPF